jgi:divalent metal cation (Fe/Co/Zn/Cd) transporter
MKYKVAWNSPRQGIRSTEVDALNAFAAQEQVESMYAHVDGFRIIHTTPVFEKKEYSKPEQSYSSESSSDGGIDFDSVSEFVATVGIMGGILVALFGLFTLPAGIIAMVIGGGIGWLGWKLGCWMQDKGW